MVVPVVADADTLFGGTTRGLLIHLDYRGLIRLHWSPLILQEMSRALVDTGRKSDPAASRREALMRNALPQAEVPTADVQSQFKAVAGAMRSVKDIHVAACANVLRVQRYYPNTPLVSLITKNIRDFGVKKLATLGIEVQHPDAFLLNLLVRVRLVSPPPSRHCVAHYAPSQYLTNSSKNCVPTAKLQWRPTCWTHGRPVL